MRPNQTLITRPDAQRTTMTTTTKTRANNNYRVSLTSHYGLVRLCLRWRNLVLGLRAGRQSSGCLQFRERDVLRGRGSERNHQMLRHIVNRHTFTHNIYTYIRSLTNRYMPKATKLTHKRTTFVLIWLTHTAFTQIMLVPERRRAIWRAANEPTISFLSVCMRRIDNKLVVRVIHWRRKQKQKTHTGRNGDDCLSIKQYVRRGRRRDRQAYVCVCVCECLIATSFYSNIWIY